MNSVGGARKIAATEVVYITGAPGVGKSTLVQHLCHIYPNARAFAYGSQMAEHLSRTGAGVNELDLRAGTDRRVTREDVRTVNAKLREWIRVNRDGHLLLVDAHQVTLEDGSFRLIPFEEQELHKLGLTKIWVITGSHRAVAERISENPRGRRVPCIWKAELHHHLQLNVAVTYAIHLGIELRLFDADVPPEQFAAFVSGSVQTGS